jgi:hypothetical protein
MKRVVLVLTLCVAALAVAAVGSASAVLVTGKCELKGPTTFEPPISLVPSVSGHYKFESEKPGGVVCATTPATAEGFAKVEGKGVLSCAASVPNPPGTGEVTYKEGATAVKHPIEQFVFLGVGAVVPFVAVGPNVKAVGVAHFPPGAATQCVPPGTATLTFEAVIAPGSEI